MENALQRSPIISKLTCGVCYNVGGEDGDRLSNLPEPIIHHIFSFLETIDVVRASAVSRKWRYLWLSIPYLNFNVHNICSNPLERWSLQTTNEKFKDFVNWVLLFQNGSVNEPIKLPRSLVTCESLVSLKLDFGNREHQGVLNLPTCVGFSRLKSLDLQHVEFLNAILEQRSYFSASFNNLKSLILCVTTAEWTVPLIIRLLNHSPNLEVLTIYFDSDEYYDDWEIPDKVILCLTCHLKTVELIDFSGNENELELVRFLLKNGHVLQKLRVSWLERCGES
ncbi:hypothetical protein CUMW_263280 [Citrus unshiu]|uniref:F-box domain-containing protein n=1 Tax=Citrus unshiu TaxID=55188 RepID=A0A2H5QUM9_CITUN|nr:hypothetical protein CUMW_263280 [Citrus unshiu]